MSGPVVSLIAPSLGTDRLCRLTHHKKMERVWQDLLKEMEQVAARVAPEPRMSAVDAWLRGYLLTALTADISVRDLRGTPNLAEQRKTMVEIANRARALMRLLDEHVPVPSWIVARLDEALARATCPEGRVVVLDGKGITGAAVPASIQDLFSQLAAENYQHYWFSQTSPSPTAPLRTASSHIVLAGLVQRLHALVALADLSAQRSESCKRVPSKTKRFPAAVYVQTLAGYLTALAMKPRQDRGRKKGFPLHLLIADTATVALDRPAPLDADFVRRHIPSGMRSIDPGDRYD